MPDLEKYLNLFNECFLGEKLKPVALETVQELLDPDDFRVPKNARPEPVEKKPAERELLEIGQQVYDPIQALKAQLKSQGGKDDKTPKDDDSESDGGFGEDLNDKDYVPKKRIPRADPRLKKHEDEEDHYSDIDDMVEDEIKNKKFEAEIDYFDELLGETVQKKADFTDLDNNERPDWEGDAFNASPSKLNSQDLLEMLKKDKNQLFGTKVIEKKKEESKAPEPQKTFQQPTINTNSGNFGGGGFSGGGYSGGVDFAKLMFETNQQTQQQQSNYFFNQDDDDEKWGTAFSMFSAKPKNFKHGEQSLDSALKNFVSGLGLGPSTSPVKITNQQPTIIRPSTLQPQNTIQQNVNQQTNQQQSGYSMMGGIQQNQLQTTQDQLMNIIQPPLRKEASKEIPNLVQGPKKRPNPMYPSFIFRYYSGEYDAPMWFYMDKEKKWGPYSGKSMDQWYADGYLPLELKVTVGEENQFRTIREIADYIVTRTINGDGPPPEKKKPQNEALNKLMETMDKNDIKNLSSNFVAPMKAKTVDEIEPMVNYERWAEPAEKPKKEDKPHNKDGKNYKNYNNRGNYNNRYNNQGQFQQHRNYNQGNRFNNQGNFNKQNQIVITKPNQQTTEGGEIQTQLSQTPLENITNISGLDDVNQIKALLGMVKPSSQTEGELQPQQQQIQQNQQQHHHHHHQHQSHNQQVATPKIDISDFPSLSDTYKN